MVAYMSIKKYFFLKKRLDNMTSSMFIMGYMKTPNRGVRKMKHLDDTYTFYLEDSPDGKVVQVFDKNGKVWPINSTHVGGYAPLIDCDYAKYMHEFNQVHAKVRIAHPFV